MKYVLLTFLLSFASVSFAQFSYAPINVPGAIATEARGINPTAFRRRFWA